MIKISWLIDSLHARNTKTKGAKNLNCALIGESGSGKSYGALKICQEYYDQKLNKKFPIDNVVFTIAEFLGRVEQIEKCGCIIFDDSGLKYSSARWYEDLNQVLGYTLQSYRYRIINVFFTIPVKEWLDRIGRGMLHSQIEMRCPGVGVYYKITYNSKYKKFYNKRLRIIGFSLPSDKLLTMYEDKKDKFLKKEYKTYLNKALEYESGDLSSEDIIKTILKDPDKYKFKGKFNPVLIHENLKLSMRRTKRILVLMEHKGVIE